MIWFRRVVATLVLGYLGLMCAATLVVQFMGERTEIGTVALFAPRHLTIWPWLPLVLLAAFTSQKLVIACAIGAVVTLFGVSGFQIPSLSAIARTDSADITGGTGSAGGTLGSERETIRVVSYNTDYSRSLGRRVAFDVAAWDADIASFIDCRPDVRQALLEVPNTTLVAQGFLCLLSRYDITEHERIPQARLDPEVRARAGRSGRVHRFVLNVHGRPVTLYVLHLETPRNALFAARHLDFSQLSSDAAYRAADSRTASRWIDRSTPALIVMGDFNLPVESTIYRRDWGDLTNVFDEVGFGFGHTMFAGRHRVRIDHVLIGSAFEPLSSRVLSGYPSEHQPVVVELRLR